MKHFLLTTLLVGTMTMPALSNEVLHFTSRPDKEISAKGIKKMISPALKAPRAAAAGETVDLTIKWDYSDDPDWYDTAPIFVLEDNDGNYFVIDEDEIKHSPNRTAKLTVPKGTYHGVMMFGVDTPECHGMLKLVFMEDKEITRNQTLLFDGKTATHRITQRYRLPTGELANLIDFSDDPAEDYRDYTKGNCTGDGFVMLRSLKNPEVCAAHMYYLQVDWPEQMGSSRIKCTDVFVNTTTDDYDIYTTMMLYATDRDVKGINTWIPPFMTSHAVSFKTEDDLDQIINQSPADFVTVELPPVTKSLSTDEPAIFDYLSSSTPTAEYHMRNMTRGGWWNFSVTMPTYVQEGSIMTDIDEDAQILIDLCSNESGRMDEKSIFSLNGIVSPKFIVRRDGTVDYIMHDNIGTRMGFDEIMRVNWGTLNQFEGHPFYSFNSSDMDVEFGNSAPILSFPIRQSHPMSETYYPYPDWSCIPTYVGNFGERRLIDNLFMDFKVKAGDEVIMTSYDDFPWPMMDHATNQHDGHDILLTFDNKNFEIDGLQGRTYAEIKYKEKVGGDISAPSVQMMQFRNAENKITNRLDNADESTINISYGDFSYSYVEGDVRFIVDPCDIKIEVAPYGSDDFAEVETEENPDYFLMPVWGYFRSGKLANLGKSDNGWWDVRLTLKDAAGNSTFQHVSPAFYAKNTDVSGINVIDSTTGFFVNGLTVSTTDGADANFEVYSLNGSKTILKQGKSVSLSGIAPGIYIVKASSATHTSSFKLNVN